MGICLGGFCFLVFGICMEDFGFGIWSLFGGILYFSRGMDDRHINYIEGLRKALQGKLPGVDSQMKMVPAIRQREIERLAWREDAKKAAVLICFYPGNDGISLALIRRNEYDGVHSGQISFPGGRYEESDPDLVFTALREAEEEINIPASKVDVLGEITPVYIPPSNFMVKPVVGWIPEKPDFIPEPSEVSEIVCIKLSEILDHANFMNKDIPHREYKMINVPCFYIRENIIWGATAMIMSEMVDVLRSVNSGK